MIASVGLPETVRVKISSEEAGYVALTAVVNREMKVGELIGMMLGVTGKDAARIAELLRRGSLVRGGSRLRWAGIDATAEDVAPLLEAFPASDPARPFTPDACTRAVLRGPGVRIEIARDAAGRKRLFRRRSFWDALLEAAAGARYAEYSYKEDADRYSVALTAAQGQQLRKAAKLLRYPALERPIAHAAFDEVDFLVPR